MDPTVAAYRQYSRWMWIPSALLLVVALLLFLVSFAYYSPTAAAADEGAAEFFPVSTTNASGDIPVAVTSGPGDAIWYTESSGTIGRMTIDGRITGEFTIPTGPQADSPTKSEPVGITSGPDGKIWFADAGTNQEGRSFIGTIATDGRVTEFRLPTAARIPQWIVAGSDGALWFTERQGAIGRISTLGAITELTTFGEATIESPTGIAAGADGNVWVNDEAPRFYGIVDRITPLGAISQFHTNAVWTNSAPIASGADGNIWVAGATSRFVSRITPEGSITRFPVPGTSGSGAGMTLGSDGNIWLSEDFETDALLRIAPDGSFTSFSPISSEGHTPEAITSGPDGNIWFTEAGRNQIGRFIVPRRPADNAPPTLSGSTIQGQTLSVSNGSWSPASSLFSYQWQLCDTQGVNCSNLSGELGSTHYLTAVDVGHTVRVVVTAINRGLLASAASGASAVVAALPSPGGHEEGEEVKSEQARRPKVVGANMSWRFAWSSSYTLVKSLTIHSLSGGVEVEARCSGRGCPFRRRRRVLSTSTAQACSEHACKMKRQVVPGSISLVSWFKGRHLEPGVKLTVIVTKPGWVGKSFRFLTRAGKAPHVEIQCLAPVSQDAGGGC